jgi:hypothetical protein
MGDIYNASDSGNGEGTDITSELSALYKAVFSSSQDRNEIHTSTERCIEEMPS